MSISYTIKHVKSEVPDVSRPLSLCFELTGVQALDVHGLGENQYKIGNQGQGRDLLITAGAGQGSGNSMRFIQGVNLRKFHGFDCVLEAFGI